MAGYIRQSSFVDGDTITAAIFNNEYNQLVNAFSNTTGHAHDGTAAEGPVIGLIGDAGETSPNNKVLIDTTNNYIEFYVEVSSAPVQQLYIADGAIIPVTDSDVDLGTSSLYFKDTYTDTVTTTGNVTVGGNLTVTGNATISGNLTFGDADTDSINLAAEIDSDIIPNTDGTYDLGSATKEWQDLYIDGTANIDSLVADTADINGGTINGTTIATSDITVGAGKTLDVSAGTLTLADNQISGDKVEGGTIAATTITDLTFGSLNDGTITVTAFVDEDDMTSDSATLVPTQQSVKAYVDSQVTAQDLDFQGDTGGALSIDLDSETLTIAGGTGLDTVGSGNTVTVAIDSTVATLTGSQTLTNKTLTSPVINTGVSGTAVLDDDTFATATATTLATSESIKAYVDTTVAATNEVVEDSTPQLGGDLDTNGNDILFADNDKAIFGTGSDLQIYSDGSSSKIKESGAGSLVFEATNINLKDATGTDFTARFITGGDVQLYYDGSQKLATTSTGIDVTGTATMDGLVVEGNTYIDTNNGADAFYVTRYGNVQNESASFVVDDNALTINSIQDEQYGSFRINSTRDGVGTATRFNIYNDGDISFYEDTGTTAKFFWDASAESLGIGTTSPSSFNAAGTGIATVSGTGTGASTLALYSGTTSSGFLYFSDGTSGADRYQGYLEYSHSNNDMRIGTAGAEAMRIGSSGNVGIGTTSPQGDRLSVVGSDLNNDDDLITLGGAYTASTEFLASIGTHHVDVNNGGIKFSTKQSGTVAERLRIDASGNVGIGTTSPQQLLTVGNHSTVATSGNMGIRTTSSGHAISIIEDGVAGAGTDESWQLGVNSDGDLGFFNSSSSTASVTFLDSNNNVGIGTTSPAHSLDVVKAGSNIIRVQNSASSADASFYATNTVGTGIFGINATGQYMYGLGNFPLLFYANAAERMRIDSSGNVGIGTSSPSYPLHVSASSPIIASQDTDGTNQIGRFYQSGADLVLNSRNNTSRGSFDFSSSNGTDTVTRLKIDSSGNVGIGTASPARQVHLHNASGDNNLHITNNTTGATASDGFSIVSQSGSNNVILNQRESSNLIFHTGNVEAMRIDSSGNVGIGTDNPTEKLMVLDAASAYARFYTTDGTDRKMLVGVDSTAGGDINVESAHPLVFSTNDTEAMRIDSSGNLLVGTTTTTLTTNDGIMLSSDGFLHASRNGNIAGQFNRITSDGDIVRFRKDGTTVGTIGTSGGSTYIGGYQNAGLYFNGTTDIRPWNTSTQTKLDNSVNLGSSSARFKDLYLAGTAKVDSSAYISQGALTSSSNAVAWDAAAKANAYYATTENTTFSAPSNAVEGAIISVEIAQGATPYTVAWNTVFEFAASTAPTVTATANKTDIFSFRYNGSVWQEIGRTQNMAQT